MPVRPDHIRKVMSLKEANESKLFGDTMGVREEGALA